jgi:hypothetical protein
MHKDEAKRKGRKVEMKSHGGISSNDLTLLKKKNARRRKTQPKNIHKIG